MAEGSTWPPHATRFLETTRGVLSYAQLAPLLAERVLRVQQDIEDGAFAAHPLDGVLLLSLHHGICGDLVPDWAGRFRATEVEVGRHSPPHPYQVPLLVHGYFADLDARIGDVSEGRGSLLLETLAFAEGRILSIHPFPDFNGRTTRLLLAEILRRLELPPVELAPTDDAARKDYIHALEAADQLDWKPLTEIWKQRLLAT